MHEGIDHGSRMVAMELPGRIPELARTSRPWGLLAAMALVVAAECFVACHEDGRFIDPFAWSWRETSRLCRRGSGAEVVCLGDSVMQYGLAPTIVGPTTGRRAVNLALSAGQAPASYFPAPESRGAGGAARGRRG